MRAAGYAVGAALVAVGFGGLLTHAADTRPAGWLAWFAGVTIAHDFILVPAVLALAALLTRVPGRYRTPALAAAVIGGILALVALPLVLGFGRTSANPSQLPLPYGRNLLIVLSAIAVAAGAVGGRRAWSARAGRAAADGDRDALHDRDARDDRDG
jgi:hypothetical protein